MIFLLAFVIAVLVNFAITIFGKQNIEEMKKKMSIGRYLKELQLALEDEIGDRAVTIIKLVLICLAILFALFNLLGIIMAILGVVLGTFVAKKSYSIGAVSSVVNKITTYLNRL